MRDIYRFIDYFNSNLEKYIKFIRIAAGDLYTQEKSFQKFRQKKSSFSTKVFKQKFTQKFLNKFFKSFFSLRLKLTFGLSIAIF